MKIKNLVLLGIFLLSISFTVAQNHDIAGVIKDQNKKAISFASLVVYNPTDTSMVTYGISTEKGFYKLTGIKKGNYLLYAACVGYSEIYIPIIINDKNVIKNVSLKTEANVLESFKVYSKKAPILYRGDTLVYNPAYFKTKTNASVEDLLKKLPGLKVDKNGNIVSEGQEVVKVLINGKEFFGKDVKMATKNLDAEAIKKVQVIDQKTEEDAESGQDNKNTEKVINLVLKKGYNKGYFGTISASYGSSDLYNLNGNINFFTDKAQLTVIGGMNNMDKKVFGWSALRELNANEINPFYNWFSYSSSNGGISTEQGIGSNLNLTPKKGLEINLSYLTSNTDNVNTNSSNIENYLTERTVFSRSNTEKNSNFGKHVVSATMRFKIDTLSNFYFKGQFNKDKSENTSAYLKENYLAPNLTLNSGVNEYLKESNSLSYSGKIRFVRKHKKTKGSYYRMNAYFKNGDNDGDKNSYYNSQDSVVLPFPSGNNWLLNDLLKAQEKNYTLSNAYNFQLNKKAGLEIGLNLQDKVNDYDYSWIPENQGVLLANSPKGSVHTQVIEPMVRFNYKLSKYSVIYTTLKYKDYFEERVLDTDVSNAYKFNQRLLLPAIYFNSRVPRKHRFHMSLYNSLDNPSINNILPITDYSNPFFTQIGNIKLQNSPTYNLYASFNKTLKTTNNFRVYTWSNITDNASVSNIFIDKNNFRNSQSINYKNKMTSSNEIEYTHYFKKIKADIGLELNNSNNQSYFIQNFEEIKSVDQRFGIEPQIAFNKFDKWSLDISYGLQRQFGQIGTNPKSVFWNNNLEVEFVLNPLDWFEFTTDFAWQQRSGINNFATNSVPLLNVDLNFFVGKKKRLTIGTGVFDLLNSNQDINRYWSGNSFVESRQNTLTRFIMLNVKYRIKKPKGKEKKHRRRH